MSDVLSIIIVAYKSRNEIEACLASIPKTVEWLRTEILVVDNFGADDIESFVSKKFPHVKYLHPKKNLGFGRANNLGFKESAGNFVLFLNPDTICDPKALLHCV